MVIENKDTQCWVDTESQILSFSIIPNALHLEFESREQLMNYIFEHYVGYGYRVQ